MGRPKSAPLRPSSFVPGLLSKVRALLQRLVIRVLRAGPVPKHIAIIMDGNRRFAERAGMERIGGHALGCDRLIETLQNCFNLGVRYISAYAFSIDNFGRSKDEVQTLMGLMEQKLDYLVTKDCQLREQGVRVQVLGDLSLLPASVREAAERAMAATKENGAVVLNICLAYTSTEEIVHSVQEIRDEMCEIAPRVPGHIGGRSRAKERSQNGLETRPGVPANGMSHDEADGGVLRLDGWVPRDSNGSCLNGDVDEVAGVSESRNGAVSGEPAKSKPMKGGGGGPEIADLRRRLGTASLRTADDSISLRNGCIVEDKGVRDCKVDPMMESITVGEIENHLYTAGCPPPDILIRTSGETRLSNFMLWQCSTYTRLSFCKAMWPEFSLWHLAFIILDYQRAYPALQEQRRLQELGGKRGSSDS